MRRKIVCYMLVVVILLAILPNVAFAGGGNPLYAGFQKDSGLIEECRFVEYFCPSTNFLWINYFASTPMDSNGEPTYEQITNIKISFTKGTEVIYEKDMGTQLDGVVYYSFDEHDRKIEYGEYIAHLYINGLEANSCKISVTSNPTVKPREFQVLLYRRDHCTCIISNNIATSGTEIQLTIKPDNGYYVENVLVQLNRDEKVIIPVTYLGTTENGEIYSFIMPVGSVLVGCFCSKSSTLRGTINIIPNTCGGSVFASHSSAPKGNNITLTVKPNDGYKLNELVVKNNNDDFINLSKDSDDIYSFVMPSGDVIVIPSFVSSIAKVNTQTITINNKKIEFQMYALVDANGGETNYVKLRDVANVLNGTSAQFEIDYDGTISLTTGLSYTPNGSEMKTPFSGNRIYSTNDNPIKINGDQAKLSSIILTDDNGGGYTYFKFRDIGKALNFNVSWSGSQGVYIETDKPYSDAA